ncbi:MAG: hypothetical protein ABWY93_27945, partial [Mycobacterium sp.]
MTLPSGAELQQRFHQYTVTGFGKRLTTVPSTKSMRWARPAQTPVPPLLTYPPVGRSGIDDTLTQFARDTEQYLDGTAIGTAGEYLLMSLNHGWGDGHLTLRMNQVVTAPGVFAATRKERRAPLISAFATFFGRNPAKAWHVLAHPWPTPPSTDAVERPTKPARPWTPSPRNVSASTPLTVVDDIRRWREETGTRVSISSVFFAATLREMQRQNISVSNQVFTLFDCRRYLRGMTDVIEVGNNFVAGIDLHVGAAPSPADLNQAIRHTADSGRPLLSLALSGLRTALATCRRGGRTLDVPTSVDGAPMAKISFSDVGSIPFPETLWTSGVSERFFNCLSEPAEPEGMVFNFFQTGGAMHVAVSFHDNVFDAAQLKAVVEAVVANPLPELVSG